ncbi:hypothetical protein JZ751_005580 [Albula glossodonta]|uniref:Proline-rich transmembrane protein 3/4 domain-containing protein n=1 Tax=Albula glossodonta TaxID=121402 RepID=A0A8T2N484_9TELE|nr:hypothetical protein JZ751_005580 [Albula glossodonta]
MNESNREHWEANSSGALRSTGEKLATNPQRTRDKQDSADLSVPVDRDGCCQDRLACLRGRMASRSARFTGSSNRIEIKAAQRRSLSRERDRIPPGERQERWRAECDGGLKVFLGALCHFGAGCDATRMSSPPRPTTTVPTRASRGRQTGSVWPFWSVAEAETPSFLSLPFSLPFDLWSSSTRSQVQDSTGKPSESPSKTLALSNPKNLGLAGSEGPGSNLATISTWEDPTVSSRTGTADTLTDSNPLTPATMPDSGILGNRHPVASPSSIDALTQAPTQTEKPAVFTDTLNSSVPALTSGAGYQGREPTRSDDSASEPAAPVTAAAKPTFTIDRAGKKAAGTELKIDAGLFEDGMRALEDKMEVRTTTGDGRGAFEGTAQEPTRAADSVSTESPGGRLPGNDHVGPEREETSRHWTAPVSSVTPMGPLFADSLPDEDEDWPPDTTVEEPSPLPDCSPAPRGPCNTSSTWGPASDFADDIDSNLTSNQSHDPFLLLAPPMFVPLYSDWNSAMATWGVAWEAHVYGLGSLFSLVALASALNLLCLPLRCPSGCGYFALVNLFLLTACCSRAFSLFYDAYSHQDKLPAAGTLLLYELPFPCLTAAFGIVFLLLSMRSRMQISNSVFQHPCFLAVLVLLHFSATLGSVVLLQVFTRLPCLFFVSQGSFVALAAFLSSAYFAFYCYVRADAKHIYHLNNTSPPAERYHRCPFADPKDWDRAAVTAVFAAFFALACAGLQLYAMLHALGLGGVAVFHPWPWWAFHLSCRVSEAGVCVTLALVVVPPLYCSGELPQPGLCWPRLFCAGSRGHMDLKSPVMPNNYHQWALSQQDKLVICDAIARRESECLPLYTLVDNRLSSLDGLDLLYHHHSNRLSHLGDEDDDTAAGESQKSSFVSSLHLDSDSTADLHPPSPINLRRSIDEALFGDTLFGEALFSKGLFGAPQLHGGSSELSLNLDARSPSRARLFGEDPADRGLYRTSSCVEMEAMATAPPPGPEEKCSTVSSRTTLEAASGSGSSVEQWRGSGDSGSGSLLRATLDGSSLVLCSSPEEGQGHSHASFSSSRITPGHLSQSSLSQVAQLQRGYRALGCGSQDSLEGAPGAAQDLAVQAEFISVCRQIDALSVCSDTIDL